MADYLGSYGPPIADAYAIGHQPQERSLSGKSSQGQGQLYGHALQLGTEGYGAAAYSAAPAQLSTTARAEATSRRSIVSPS